MIINFDKIKMLKRLYEYRKKHDVDFDICLQSNKFCYFPIKDGIRYLPVAEHIIGVKKGESEHFLKKEKYNLLDNIEEYPIPVDVLTRAKVSLSDYNIQLYRYRRIHNVETKTVRECNKRLGLSDNYIEHPFKDGIVYAPIGEAITGSESTQDETEYFLFEAIFYKPRKD